MSLCIISIKINLNRQASILAALLMMTDLTFIGFSKSILSDVPAAFFFYLSCFLINKSSSIYSLLLSGIFFAFAALHRPNILALVPILFFFLFINIDRMHSKKKFLIFFSARTICILLPFTLLGGAWVIRNYRAFGYLTYTTWKGSGLISQLNHFLSASDLNYNLDYEKLSQVVLDKYIEENPKLKSPETLIYNNNNPLIETKEFLNYQVMFFKEKSRLIKETFMFAIPSNYLNSIFQRGNRELIPCKLFGREIGWIWTILHSLITCFGLMIMLFFSLAKHFCYKFLKLLILFFLSSIFIIATSYFSPEFPLRFLFPISMFLYICSAYGLDITHKIVT